MGSCENLAIIEKPLCGSVLEQNLNLEFSVPCVSEQRSGLEVAHRLFESKAYPPNAVDRCQDFCMVGDTGVSSSGITEAKKAFTTDSDGLVIERQNVHDLMLENVQGSECSIRGDCMIEIQTQNVASCLENRGSQGEYDCEMPFKSVQMTGSQGNFAQLDEIDHRSVSVSSPGIMEVINEKSGDLAGLETNAHNKISSSDGREMPLELIPMTDFPNGYAHQQEQGDTKNIGDLPLEVMDQKSDASARTEADVHNWISPSEGGEIPLQVLHARDSVSYGEQKCDKSDEETVGELSVERVSGIFQRTSDIDTSFQALPPQGCQRALESLHMSELPSISAQQNDWKNDNGVCGVCVERVPKVVEDKSDITTVELGTTILPLEENSCNLKEGAANITHNCTFEKSFSPPSCQPLSIANPNTSKDKTDEDIITSLNSSSVAECSGHTDNEGKDTVGIGCGFETKCPEVVSSSSRRKGQRNKSSQKINKKRAEKKRKNASHVLHPCGSIKIVLEAARLKRSSLSKPARSSIWGSLENITQFFEQSNGIYGFDQVQKKGLGKARGGRRSGKQNKRQASGSSQGSRGNCRASTSRVRLKVKVGKVAAESCLNNIDPKFVDTSVSSNVNISDYGTDLFSGTGLELPKFAGSIEDKSQEDGQLANKDTEGANTIDKAPGDAEIYLGVPSHVLVDALGGAIGNRCIDSGTSPDSEVINLTPDAQVTPRHNLYLNDALLSSSKDVAAQEHRTNSKRGKKKRIPHSRNFVLQDGSPGPTCINKAKTSKKQGCRQHMGDILCSGEIFTSLTSAIASSNSSSNKELSMEPLVFPKETEHIMLGEAWKEESAVEAKTHSILPVESHDSQNLPPPTKAMVCKLSKSGRVSKGQFLIEYVGEVLDMHAYEARQKDYAFKGHRHFYFMTLNGSEVIDACAKGNLGRFINHSCAPNCRTEKWMVNGEICIGLFALRDIKKDEEVTFDYNYVRVFGAAAKKCHCGAPQCRGYIGGDLLNSEVIVQGDSDEEFPEPVMLLEYGKSVDSLDNKMPRASPFDCAEIQTAKSILKARRGMHKATNNVGKLESTIEKDAMNQPAASQLHSSLDLEVSKERLPSFVQSVEISQQTEDVTSKPMPAVQKENSREEETVNKASSYADGLEISPTLTLSKSLFDGTDANMKSKSDTVEDKRISSKSRSQMRVSRSSSSAKKGKMSSNSLNTNRVLVTATKSQLLSIKPKKLLASSSNSRCEAVEEKLNELLDNDGGISKRKDATKGYLKLLLLTAASGDGGNGEAIQSNRDLSMILDALLKTKSRAVLIDIINKNGLRMLHNIMKFYRRDFKKIPILRKLLKVLEYLAVRDILTTEHINVGPPCHGMESFRKSILSLTEHDDKQVHQIARNFRDRWIPRPVRKLSYLDRDDGRMEILRGSNCNRFLSSNNYWHDLDARPTEAIDCVNQSMVAMPSYDSGNQEGCSAPCVGGCLTSERKTRKRKSRWDQPAETNPGSRSPLKEQKIESSLIQQFESWPLQGGSVEEALDHTDTVSRKNGNFNGCVDDHSQQDEALRADHGSQNIPDDVPPGFSSPQAQGLSYASSAAMDLHRQNVCHMKRPFDAVVGQPQGKFISCLPVSYGMPLSIVQPFGTPNAESVDGWFIAPGMPFQPFPPLPPFPRDNKDRPTSHASNPLSIDQPAVGQRNGHYPTPCHADETLKNLDIPSSHSQQPFKRMRESSYSSGRRYFRPEKWNAPKTVPPWLRKRNGWGQVADSLRGSSCGKRIGNVANEATNSYLPEDVSCRGEKAGNNYYQHSQNQNHH
ncbi:hypothetical protein I3760_15G029600 [Carya illinoinensis]|nr:hypothetical protein I3760_15G029600 [Carya illinoinensis]